MILADASVILTALPLMEVSVTGSFAMFATKLVTFLMTLLVSVAGTQSIRELNVDGLPAQRRLREIFANGIPLYPPSPVWSCTKNHTVMLRINRDGFDWSYYWACMEVSIVF